jgi:small-conductance mechanosensitive channel
VQKFPAPGVLFTGMTDNALKFELVCFVSDVEVSARIRSDLNFEILKRLRDEGIAVFSAPTNIALVDVERIETALSRAMKTDRTT